jgi:hypothetical protein
MTSSEDVIGTLSDASRPLVGARPDYDYLLELIGHARLVLWGEPRMALTSFIVSEQKSPKG